MTDVLPPAPRKLLSGYVLKRSLGVIALAIAGLGVGGAYGIWQAGIAAEILRDSRIWAEADGEVEGNVGGNVTTRNFIFDSYKLSVRFEDDAGQTRGREIEFDTLFSSVDQSKPGIVRYQKAQPDEFALSWAVDVTGGRWMAFAFMVIVGVGALGGIMLFGAAQLYKTTRAAQRAASNGVETVCAISGVEEQVVDGRRTGNRIYRFTIPEHMYVGKGAEQQAVMNPKHGTPIMLEGGTKLIALIDPAAPTSPLVVRNDLFPLAVDEVTRQAALEQISRLT